MTNAPVARAPKTKDAIPPSSQPKENPMNQNLNRKARDENDARADAPAEPIETAVAALRDENHKRLDALETRAENTDRLAEQMRGIAASVDEMALKAARPPLEAPRDQAFADYLRRGITTHENRSAAPEAIKADPLAITADTAGALAPGAVEQGIASRLAIYSPMRRLAEVRNVVASSYVKPIATDAAATAWGTDAARPAADAPNLETITFPFGEVYASPAASQSMLDDVGARLEEWLINETAASVADKEEEAFIKGNGKNRPQGLLVADAVTNAANKAWNQALAVETRLKAGNVANFEALLTDVVYSLPARYRQNASWIMNRRTQAAIRKAIDEKLSTAWQPPASAGAPPSLFGYPVIESEHVDDIAAGKRFIAFGDFRQAYLILDRAGIRTLRDPYTRKPYVYFYMTKRVGGGVQNYDAFVMLAVAS